MSLPCIDCITFAICKNQYIKEQGNIPNRNGGYLYLRLKCNLLNQFFNDSTRQYPQAYNEFINYIEKGISLNDHTTL